MKITTETKIVKSRGMRIHSLNGRSYTARDMKIMKVSKIRSLVDELGYRINGLCKTGIMKGFLVR